MPVARLARVDEGLELLLARRGRQLLRQLQVGADNLWLVDNHLRWSESRESRSGLGDGVEMIVARVEKTMVTAWK